MADLIPPMLIKLQADVADLKTGLAQAENAIKGVDKSVQTASSGMENFATKVKQIGASLGIAFAGAQVISFTKDVINSALEAGAQQQRLAALMKVTVGATNEQIASLNAQADALEKVGVVTGGNITQTQSQLATFNLQTETIKKLTPAILDYVTSEKGANASTDEFKQMTNGLAQALNGNFGSLTRVGFVLDDHTKKLISSGTEAERAAAIVDVLDSTYKGFNASLRDTPAGQIQVLKNEFGKLKEDLGKALLPALLAVADTLVNVIMPGFRALGKYISDNAGAIKTYITIVAGLTAAFYAYRAALVVTKVAQEGYVVWQTLSKGATLASIASTNGLAASMLALNAAMRANPLGIILTAVLVLGAAFVWLWKNVDGFKSGAIKAAQGVMYAFAGLVGAMGKLLGIIGKLPGMGWAKGLSKGAEDFANKINIAGKNLSDLNSKVKAGYGEGAFTYGSGGGGTTPKPTGSTLTDAQKKTLEDNKKKLEGYKKDVVGIYKDMNKIITQAQEDAVTELENRNDKMIEAQKNYDETSVNALKKYNDTIAEAIKTHDERVADLQYNFDDIKAKAEKRDKETRADAQIKFEERTLEIQKTYDERKDELNKRKQELVEKAEKVNTDKLTELQAKFEETKAAAQKRYDKAHDDAVDKKQKTEDAANKRYADIKLQIENDYAKKKIDLETNLSNKIADIREKAAKKATDLTLAATDKQLGIVQQSMDRLRNAFASKTGFDLGAAFSGEGANASTLLEDLKKSLSAAKTLQANAGTLAGMGYSQVFIEEVVKQGPEAGNKIAEALKNASPQATSELQSLYGDLTTVSTTGLDALATAMNQGGRLATKELTDAYRAVSSDLALALSEVKSELQTNLADINTAYDLALAESKITRDEKLADAMTTLNEALATAKTDYDASIADAEATLKDALKTADKDLADGIANALKALNEAKAAAEKDLTDGLAEASKAYIEANAKAQKDLDETIAASKKTLADAMAEAQKDLDKGIADAAKSLTEAKAKAQTDLSETLADAQKTLQDALLAAQKDYETAIDAINKSTKDKLADLKLKLAEVAANIKALGDAKDAAAALANAPKYVPPVIEAIPGSGSNITGSGTSITPGTNITINTTNLTDPNAVATVVANEIKYGAVVTGTISGTKAS